MIINEYIEVKWNAATKKRWEELGYKYTKLGDTFLVKVVDLLPGSGVVEERKCDICGKLYKKIHKDHISTYNRFNKDVCPYCSKYNEEILSIIKRKKVNTCLDNLGVEYPTQSQTIRDKVKETNLEKYGFEYNLQAPEVRDVIKLTNLKKYGVEYASQNPEIKEKIKNTNLKRYGGVAPMCNEVIKEKERQTNLEKYGVEYTLMIPEIKEKGSQAIKDKYGVDSPLQITEIQRKARRAAEAKGKINTSYYEIKVGELLQNNFTVLSEYPSVLSYSPDYILDCGDFLVDVEIDGYYWHHTKSQLSHDNKRDGAFFHYGYKVLRIKYDGRKNSPLPTTSQIKEAVEQLKNGERKVELYLDSWPQKEKE